MLSVRGMRCTSPDLFTDSNVFQYGGDRLCTGMTHTSSTLSAYLSCQSYWVDLCQNKFLSPYWNTLNHLFFRHQTGATGAWNAWRYPVSKQGWTERRNASVFQYGQTGQGMDTNSVSNDCPDSLRGHWRSLVCNLASLAHSYFLFDTILKHTKFFSTKDGMCCFTWTRRTG